MGSQPANQRFRQAVRGFYAWLGSVVFAAVAPVGAGMLIRTGSPTGRALGVVLGSLGWVPTAWVVTAIIRAGDEFHRQLHLVSLAVAFGASLVVLTALGWAVRAKFIASPSLEVLWVTFAVLWLVSLIVCKRRFERVA